MPRSFLITNRRYCTTPQIARPRFLSSTPDGFDTKWSALELNELSLLPIHVAKSRRLNSLWPKLSPALSDASDSAETCSTSCVSGETVVKEIADQQDQQKIKRKGWTDQNESIEKISKRPSTIETRLQRTNEPEWRRNSSSNKNSVNQLSSAESESDDLDKDLLSLTPPSTPCTLFSSGSSDVHVCPDCGKQYSTSSNLTRHRQTHRSVTDKKARKCPHCDKVYVSMPAYSMHVRTHTQGCQCHYCGKCFSRPWLLQGHIRTHTGEKPFKCHICAKSFADKSNLRAHVQTHSLTKPYICDRCGKAFALKSYLYKHEESSCMRLHRQNGFTRDTHSPDDLTSDSSVRILQASNVDS